MVTAAGGNAARQAGVAIEYQSGLRGRPVKSMRLQRKLEKWLRGGAPFTLLCQRQLLTVSTLPHSRLSRVCVCVCVCVCKRESVVRNVTGDHLFCLHT